ncbi:MAG: thioredoxin family protein [Verrucomicrobia bacterium]|nr:thioredoxin family protein [Verrucomicrobiota bacterium]
MNWLRLLALPLLLALATPALAANKTSVRLLLAVESAKPGDTVLAGIHLKMEPKWHTYWRNSGDSGMPTTVKWTLPKGITAGEIEWPLPEKFVVADQTTYAYHDEVVLVVPLKIPPDAPTGLMELHARVAWLECEVQCVQGKTEVAATLNIAGETRPSADAALIEKFRALVPVPNVAPVARAGWAGAAKGDSRPLIITTDGAAGDVDFFPYGTDASEVAALTEKIAPGQIRKLVKKSSGDWPATLTGVLVQRADAARAPVAHEVQLAVAATAPTGVGGETPPGASPVDERSLVLMLAFAFIGGLILNVMPCVLPVIALKVLGFVQQSKSSPGSVRKHGLIYMVGVLCSFLVLAGVVVGVQQAGKLASWGMQFGNPKFIVAMVVLVTLVALNLFGLFEIILGGRAMGAATELSGKEGNAGAFFNGVLATALATPCTAPFLGAALGFAFAQPPVVVVLMFLVIGLGLALPYVLLSFMPQLFVFLPRPGAWMEKFKIAMGFPMLATAAWLAFDVGAAHFGRQVFWLGIFLVLLAMAAWVWGEFVQRGRKHKGWAMFISVALLISGYVFILEKQLHWRAPAPVRAGGIEQTPGGIAWEPWSAETVAKARGEGRVVLVDFTADWCVTCQANKKTSLEIPSVQAKLKALNAVSLLGDYTLTPDVMTAELKKFGRAGVPMVLIYPRDASKPPILLPELLTPGIVLDALEQAGK